MQTEQFNLFTRPDTFFGVCEALGEDLSIHANIFRILFAGLLFWSPESAIGAYAGVGALVALTRWLSPNPRPVKEEVAAAEAVAEPEAEPMPLAA